MVGRIVGKIPRQWLEPGWRQRNKHGLGSLGGSSTKTDSQASISASSSGRAAVVKFVLLYQVSLRPLKICRLQLESLKGFQA